MEETIHTYYHYQGFVYGSVTEEKPECFRGDESDEDCPECWNFIKHILSLPKYKWTGPPLKDWKEMIEGKDFRLKMDAKADELGWRSTKAIPINP